MCFDLQGVLEQLPEPPAEESTLAALKRLQDLGALDEEDVRSLSYLRIWIKAFFSKWYVEAGGTFDVIPLLTT